MKNPHTILVLNISMGGISLLSRPIAAAGLIRDKDFMCFDRTGIVETTAVHPGEPQLLVAASFRGELARLVELVNAMKLANPMLIAILVDLIPETDPVFDLKIDLSADEWYERLRIATLDFLSGKLRGLVEVR